MYKIYVLKQRKGGSEVFKESRTHTDDFEAACKAFWNLYNYEPYHDSKNLLLMSYNSQKIAVYRYCSKEGDVNYIRYGSQLNPPPSAP